MPSEAPIISKALRLASVVILVAVLALAASVGYSGYQEYQVLGSAFSQHGGMQQGNSSQISESLNGNQLAIGGISVPNNMTYPLGLELYGTVYLGGVEVSSFSSPMQTIMPGKVGQLQVTATANYSAIFANAKAFANMLQNQVNLSTIFSIYASLIPVAGLNVSNTSNSTVGPILGNFSVSPETPYLSTNGTYVVPLQMSWNNSSPLAFQANLGGVLTKVPGEPSGNYGSTSSAINVTQGTNQQTLYFQIPPSEFNPQEIHGQYGFNLTISAYGVSITIPESANY